MDNIRRANSFYKPIPGRGRKKNQETVTKFGEIFLKNLINDLNVLLGAMLASVYCISLLTWVFRKEMVATVNSNGKPCGEEIAISSLKSAFSSLQY